MDPRTLARALAYGRIGFGVALLVAPGVIGGLWAGRDGRRPAARLLATGFGARDLALGVGTAVALSRGGDARPWMQAAVAADLGDLLATLRVRGDVPVLSAVGVSAMAGGAAALGAWVQRELD
jgi:hypothetical protein